MKLLIASDIHGSAYWCEKLMALAESDQPDKLVLLGDLLYHGPRNDLPRDYAPKKVIPMLSAWKEKIIAVRGNCEAEVDQMVLTFPVLADYCLVELDGHLVFATASGGRQVPVPDPWSSCQPGESSPAAGGVYFPVRPHPCENR